MPTYTLVKFTLIRNFVVVGKRSGITRSTTPTGPTGTVTRQEVLARGTASVKGYDLVAKVFIKFRIVSITFSSPMEVLIMT